MTQNTGPVPGASYAPPPTTPIEPRPPLRRVRTDRVLAGVAGGVARWLGIDPVIVRVVLVILAIFGGSGLLLYVLGWLFIPEEGDPSSEAEKLIERGRQPGSTTRTVLIVGGVVLGVIVLVNLLSFGPMNGVWGFGGGSSLLLLLIVGGLVLWLANRPASGTAAWTPPSVPSAPSASAPTDSTTPTAADHDAVALTSTTAADTVTAADAAGFAYGGYGGYPGYAAPVPTPTPPSAPRQRSYLGLATMSLALVTMGTLGALSMAGVANIPAVVVLSAGVGVLGLGLLVGTIVGRARWLIALALPLLMVTVLVALLPSNLRLGNGIGERVWTPTTPAAAAGPFRLGIGDAELDLTDVVFPAGSTATYPVSASVDVGELRVIAPEGVTVLVTATNGLGEITVEGLPRTSGQDRQIITELPGIVPESAPTIDLIVDVAVGNLEVSRA
ncbi:MAG: PspC domain-containing protein [Actinobacteria bacterium]|jgi:phage shock protein PspC (stress-responsive transcriptional regulator)|nr:PspC domain-containing protein [Actinomycetota bacterium]